MTKEEKLIKIQSLKDKIIELKKQENQYNAMQMALKLVLNGTYGAFGNEFFVCSNKDIASAITGMGRNLIQYMDKCNQDYWYNKWHLDTLLHEHLGITDVKAIDWSWINTVTKDLINLEEYDKETLNKEYLGGIVNRKVPVSIYADTDSLFVGFEPAMSSCNWVGDELEFIHKIYKFRLAGFFKTKLEDYAAKFGVINIQDFELERINQSIIFLGKKTYIQNVRWEDGVNYKELEYLYPKGVQMVKSSTPKFARLKVFEIVQYLLSHPKDYSLKNILKLVKDIKKQFELADIEDISLTISCSNYKENVIDDVNSMRFTEGLTFWAIKTAAHHNFLMNQKQEYKDKYEHIKSGNKMKFYPCKNAAYDKFGYLRGSYPKEFAPEVDYDKLFQTIVLNQVNAYINSLNLPLLNSRLKVILPLF